MKSGIGANGLYQNGSTEGINMVNVLQNKEGFKYSKGKYFIEQW